MRNRHEDGLPKPKEILITPELVDAAERGEEKAIVRLYHAAYPTVHRVALSLMGNHHDAEDVASDTLNKSFKALQEGKFERRATFRTWIYGHTINMAKTHLGKRNHRPASLDAILEIEGDSKKLKPLHAKEKSVEDQGVERVEAQRIRNAIDQLSPKFRAVVVLRFFDDMKHPEIAEALGISENDSKVTLHRANKLLKDMLFPEEK